MMARLDFLFGDGWMAYNGVLTPWRFWEDTVALEPLDKPSRMKTSGWDIADGVLRQ